jgi:hypothetical protein
MVIRSKTTLFLITLTALVFTVPWFFTNPDTATQGHVATILGFPLWAFYSVVSSFLYACLISWCLGRYWDLAAGDDGCD